MAALAAPAAALGARMAPSRPAAPEFAGIADWLNGPPLTMAGLRGRVVLVDFWDYACINCIRSLPFLTRWHNAYRGRGLVVVGVHTPEFGFERDPDRVRAAAARFGVAYPVALDNEARTWRAFGAKYWPTQYVVDRNGGLALRHVGEGAYDQTENAIRALLDAGPPVGPEDGADLSGVHTPEMYLGLRRLEFLASPEPPRQGPAHYSLSAALPRDRFALGGVWDLDGERARLIQDGGIVQARFRAGRVYVTARSDVPAVVAVAIDGRPLAAVRVHESRLYPLFERGAPGDHVLTLTGLPAGFEAYTISFG